MTKRILLAGGYGVVGAQAARLLRKQHPEAEILIGGRREKEAVAVEPVDGDARGVAPDARNVDSQVRRPALHGRRVGRMGAAGVFIIHGAWESGETPRVWRSFGGE